MLFVMNLRAKFDPLHDVTPFCPPFPNFTFLSLILLVMHLHAKFDVSCSNDFRDMGRVPKFQNCVT